MNKIMILCSLLLLILACAGTSRQTDQPITQADYGPYPSNYEQAIKDAVSPTLIDPYSAVYELGLVKQGKNSMAGDTVYGWNICGTINAKNRMGGYVGPKPVYAMFKDGRIIRLLFAGVTIPDSFKMGIISGAMTTSRSSEEFCRD